MPDRWQTYPLEFKGGLITNLSPLQHGSAAPGSARTLTNFEPSIEGGYRRIEGFTKYNPNAVTGTADSAILGLGRFRGSTIAARAQDSGNPRLYLASSTGTHTDLSTSIQLTSAVTRVRFATFNFDGDEDTIIVDGKGYPCVLVGTGAGNLSKLSTPSDISGASHVVVFKNHIFLGNGDKLIWSAPSSATDYTPANGAAVQPVGDTITALQVFRDQLIIFCANRILKLVGSSFADFAMQPITIGVGCVNGDTVQEVGGDVVFLSQDSIRTLSATDRVGDFNLASVSKNIQNDFSDFIQNHQYFSSIIIPSKTQYRIFGYSDSITEANARGFIGTQIIGQSGVEFHWGKTTGIRARVAADSIEDGVETAVFANTDGYIYKLESGNDFDGDNIKADFATPYFPITDPRTRKTIYKTILYTDPQGSFSTDFNLKFDLAESGTVQPDTIAISNSASGTTVSLYGSSGARFAQGAKFTGDEAVGSDNINLESVSFDSTAGYTVGDTFRVDDVVKATTNGAVNNSTSVTLDNNQVATAKVTDAISGVTALVVNNNEGVIKTGMLVTGTGISGTPTVEAITNNQTTITLSTSQSLSDNVDLTFKSEIKVGMTVTGTGISDTVTVSAVGSQTSITLSAAQTIADNVDLTFSHADTYEITTAPAVSGSAGSATVTALRFSPALTTIVKDHTHMTFTKIAGETLSSYSGDTLKKVFETQTVGSGFLVSMSFATDSTDPPYSLDAASLEFGQYGRR